MSVGLKLLTDTDYDFDDIEVMAPDYSKEYVWLWQGGEDGMDQRIDISRSQLTQFVALINEILT